MRAIMANGACCCRAANFKREAGDLVAMLATEAH